MIKISIIVPAYNEQECIALSVAEIIEKVDVLGISYEIIIVDDGSRDDTYGRLLTFADNPKVKIVRLRRNYGQTAAMSAGFDLAEGDIVIPIDADMQNDPADIPLLLAEIENGADVVSGWRKDRKDKAVSRRFPSWMANEIISRLTGVRLHDYGCTLKAYKKEIISEINLYGELHRFVPALASQVGADVREVPVNHRPRVHGVSKYGIDRTLRVILDLFTVKFLLNYSTKPMQLFGRWGFYLACAALASGGMTLYLKVFEDFKVHRNPLFTLTIFLLVAVVQLTATGLIGEIATRTYFESQGKTFYKIRDKVGFSAK